MSGQINGSFGVIVAGKDRLVVTDRPTDGGIEPGQMRDQPATSTARWMFEEAARAHGFDPEAVAKGGPQDEQVTRTLTDALRRLSEQPRGKAGAASDVEAMRGVIRDAAREGAVAGGSETAGPQAGLSATATSSRTDGLSAEQAGSKMGAGSVAGQQKEQQEACKGPAFRDILGNPQVEARIAEAMAAAQSTPNLGLGRDIPGNGSEHGFWAARIPLYGTFAGSTFTDRREAQMSFSQATQPWFGSGMTAIHTHQSPRGTGILSGADIDLTFPLPRGLGVNVVAINEDGARYCRAAQ